MGGTLGIPGLKYRPITRSATILCIWINFNSKIDGLPSQNGRVEIGCLIHYDRKHISLARAKRVQQSD